MLKDNEMDGPVFKMKDDPRPAFPATGRSPPHRNQLSFEEWMALDVKYVKERSFLVDWKIIFATFRAVLFGHGE